MIDNKKIEDVAKVYMIGEFYDMDEAEWNYPITNEEKRNQCIIDFKAGVKWTINQFLKDLWHPSSEEPKNLEYIVFTTTMFGEVYLFTKQVNNTQDWKTIVETHGIEQWVYRDDIVSLIFKEVKE